MKSLGRILLIADDPVEFDRLQMMFTHVATAWDIEYCKTDKDALAHLEKTEFEAIFADLVAGPLATAQFLHDIWKKHPKTVRFLMAPSIDTDVMVTCVLGAHQYLQQPLSEEALRTALKRVEFISNLVGNQRIQSLVSRMRTLPSRPSLYLEIMRELRSQNANAKVIGDLVSKDLAISTKLIQVVNSAYYGLAQQVTEPSDAVLLLGLDTTASLVLSIEAFARFDKVKPLYFSIDQVWKHSQQLAQSAKKITELMTHDSTIAKDAFTAGLLHDIGKLTLALNFEEQYQGALKLAEKKGLPACEVESEVFGANHAEAGAYLLSLWGLPFPIIEAVASHHLPAPELEPEFSAVTAVHLAERLEHESELERFPGNSVEIDLAYPDALGIHDELHALRRIVRGEDKDSGTTFQVKRPATTEGTEEKAEIKPALPIIVPAAEPIKYTVKKDQVPKTRIAFVISGICIIIVLLIVGAITTTRTLIAAVTPAPAPKKIARNQTSNRSVPSTRVLTTSQPEKTEVEPAAKATSVQTSPESHTVPDLTPQQMADDTFSKLKVQAIMYHGVDSSVLINGRSLRLGDSIEGARIFSVEPLAVTLDKEGFQHKYRLK
jgi:putative nucleotidyltransferase with HDIG domain